MKFIVIQIIGLLLLDVIHLTSSQHEAVKLISLNKPTDMELFQNIYPDQIKENGVDGNKSSYFITGLLSHNYFLINLLNVYNISYILIFNRKDSNGERLAKVNISIGNSRRNFKQCGYFHGPGTTGGIYNITCGGTGKFVFLQQSVNEYFHLAEIEVYGTELISEIPITPEQCLDIRFEEQNYYEGTLSTAADGTKCIDFNVTYPLPTVGYFPSSFTTKTTRSYKNCCRNPNNYIHHWCYISKTEWKECNLRRCTTVEDYSQLLSHRKPTEMSSHIRSRAHYTSHTNGVDGMYNNYFITNYKNMSWWRVDLIELCEIRFILMFNRNDIDGLELTNIQINIGKNISNFIQCAEFEGPAIMRKAYNITCKGVGKIVELKQNVEACFHLSEVEVYGEIIEYSNSLSYRKPADMSSIHDTQFTAELGVDGYTNTYFQTKSEAINWWRVDLIDFYEIKSIKMYTIKTCCGERIRNVTISVGDFNVNVKRCAFFEGPGVTGEVYDIKCKCIGRIVQLMQLVSNLVLSEVAVYGDKLVDGNWADWSPPYESAINTCHKSRNCTNPKPQHGGQNCQGLSITKVKCPSIDGYWTEWSPPYESDINNCHKSRTCTNPEPRYGGQNCQGLSITKVKCPSIDGQWSQWTSCKSVCADGTVECVQYRNCSNPSPKYGGKICKGEKSMNKTCPINGQWSKWTSCKSVCANGTGECMKHRNCSNPSPQFNGTYCKGENSMKEACPSVPSATTNLNVYYIIWPLICIISVVIIIVWSILKDLKEKRREDKEYDMVMAGVYQNVVNAKKQNTQIINQDSQIVNPNPQVINPNPQIVNPNPQIVNPNPQIVNPNPQIVEEDNKIEE